MNKILAITGVIALASILTLGVFAPSAFAVSPNSSTKPLCHYDDKGTDGIKDTGDEGWEQIDVNENALDHHERLHEGPGPDTNVSLRGTTVFIDSVVSDFEITNPTDQAICDYLISNF